MINIKTYLPNHLNNTYKTIEKLFKRNEKLTKK